MRADLSSGLKVRLDFFHPTLDLKLLFPLFSSPQSAPSRILATFSIANLLLGIGKKPFALKGCWQRVKISLIVLLCRIYEPDYASVFRSRSAPFNTLTAFVWQVFHLDGKYSSDCYFVAGTAFAQVQIFLVGRLLVETSGSKLFLLSGHDWRLSTVRLRSDGRLPLRPWQELEAEHIRL
jgi:hypothetical protein